MRCFRIRKFRKCIPPKNTQPLNMYETDDFEIDKILAAAEAVANETEVINTTEETIVVPIDMMEDAVHVSDDTNEPERFEEVDEPESLLEESLSDLSLSDEKKVDSDTSNGLIIATPISNSNKILNYNLNKRYITNKNNSKNKKIKRYRYKRKTFIN